MAEVLDGCGLAERAFGPQKGDRQRFFQCEAFAHDLAEDARNRLARQWSFVQVLDAAQDFGFTLGTVNDAATLDFANGPGMPCPGVESR